MQARQQQQEAYRAAAAQREADAAASRERQRVDFEKRAAAAADLQKAIQDTGTTLGNAVMTGRAKGREEAIQAQERRDQAADESNQRQAELSQETTSSTSVSQTSIVSNELRAPQTSHSTRVTTNLQGEHFPETRKTVISDSYASRLSYAKLRYAINEIYARYGAPFKHDPAIRSHFEQYDWYRPNESLTNDDIDAAMSEVEKANVVTLAKFREATKP